MNIQRKSKGALAEYFESSMLLHILKAIFLGGIIEEFSIIVKENIATIAVVDKTACLFAFARGVIGSMKDCAIGIKDGGFFIKAIEETKQDKINYLIDDEKWFKINLPGSGDIKILLTPPEMIPTSIVDYEEPLQKLKDLIAFSFTPDKEGCLKFIYFQNLVKNETTRIFADGNAIFVGSGKHETKTFSVKIGEMQPKAAMAFAAAIKGDHLSAILSVLSWDKELPQISIGPEAPIIISQGDDFMWSLSQSVEN